MASPRCGISLFGCRSTHRLKRQFSPETGSRGRKAKATVPPRKSPSHNSPLYVSLPGALPIPARGPKQSPTLFRSRYPSIIFSTQSKTSLGSGTRPDRSHRTRGDLGLMITRPDRSHRTREDLRLMITVPSMKGRATSRWTVKPSDDPCRIWTMKDTSESSSSTQDYPQRL